MLCFLEAACLQFLPTLDFLPPWNHTLVNIRTMYEDANQTVNYSLKYELVASSRALRYVRKAKDDLGGVGTTYVINMWAVPGRN